MQHSMAVVSNDRPVGRTRARAGIAAYFVAVAAALVATLIVSEPVAWMLRGGVGLLAVLGALTAARRSPHIGTNPWLCIAAGLALWTSGRLLHGLALDHGARISHWVDAMSLLGYVFVGIGLAIIARLGTDAASRTAFLDASVVAIAGAMLIWALLVTPQETVTTGAVDRLLVAAYPIGDGILIAILGWMALAPRRHSRALSILGTGIGLVLATDLVHDVARRFSYDSSTVTEVTVWFAYALIGAAGLCANRRMSDAEEGSVDSSVDTSRLTLLGLALLVGPAVSITADTTTTEGAIFVGFCSGLLAVGVIARFVNLVHENRLAHEATTISERRFRLMADSAPVGIFELARGMRVTYANSEGKGMLGAGVIGGSTEEMLRRVDPESRIHLTAAIHEVTEGRPGKADLKLAGMPDRWVSWLGVPVATQSPHLPAAFASTLDITPLKQAEAALGRQATHDPLTGLPNRRLLLEALIAALHALGRGHRTGTVALMFIDLDQFKLVNDVLGHDAGDELLKTASARLRNAVRAHDIVARFGGDEFVVLLQHVSDRGELHDVAQRILNALQVPIVVAGTPATVGASVGIATASGPDDDPDALVRNADAAMYKAKEHGRGRYEFFRPDASEKSHRML